MNQSDAKENGGQGSGFRVQGEEAKFEGLLPAKPRTLNPDPKTLPPEPRTLNPSSPLTTGSVWKGLMNLAGPMFIGTTLQNLQSVIGLFWVGRLGSDAVAALAMGGTILM
ncbi:MAG: hypothetical protein WCL49_12945, partial [bacterium]